MSEAQERMGQTLSENTSITVILDVLEKMFSNQLTTEVCQNTLESFISKVIHLLKTENYFYKLEEITKVLKLD